MKLKQLFGLLMLMLFSVTLSFASTSKVPIKKVDDGSFDVDFELHFIAPEIYVFEVLEFKSETVYLRPVNDLSIKCYTGEYVKPQNCNNNHSNHNRKI